MIGGDDVLSSDDFALVDGVGLNWITAAYHNDYATYLLKHKQEYDPNLRVLDPFHRGLLAHPWEVEEWIADAQKRRRKEGKPLLKANSLDAFYFQE